MSNTTTRTPGTDSRGNSFSTATVSAVWQKARIDANYDKDHYRRDACNKLISRTAYGSTGAYGWEVDHMKPVSKGGGDELSNLQPLYWENNRCKGDDWPTWTCKVRA